MTRSGSGPTLGIIGCGGRGLWSYVMGAVRLGRAERIVALCDVNPVRLGIAREKLGRAVATFTEPDAFFRDGDMDTVVITTPDCLHSEHALKAFAAGRHVITEKPMATSVAECDRMYAAARAAGRRLRVTFNLRYAPQLLALRTLVAQGAVGDVVALHSEDVRRIGHGSDYYRRWHRRSDCSGGLLVHKGCHTFDILNWLADSRIARVYATASRRFFTPKPGAGPRCKTCAIKTACHLYVDLDDAVPTGVPWKGFDRQLYSEAEHADGYFRDQCVFGPDITIFDNIQIAARYENGIAMTYELSTFSPYAERSFTVRGLNGTIVHDRNGSRLYPLFRGTLAEQRRQMFEPLPPQPIDPQAVLGDRAHDRGDHGGADEWLLDALLSDREDASSAGPREGRNAILIAEAAYRSIARGQAVDVAAEFGPAPDWA